MKVTLSHLSKIYEGKIKKDKTLTKAVSDLDIEIPDGALVALLGPSGCGKTTTLNMISGLEAPTEGKIYFGDEDVTSLPPEKRGIGLVFQNYALYPHMSVAKNIAFPLENLRGSEKLSKEEIDEKVLQAAKLVQIEEYLDRKPSALSGGQQQRVAIARAMVRLPKVLLLDEPLSNLDARLRLQTREEIKRIQKETKITTLFVTHDQDEAMSISDYIVVMNRGVVQQIGKPQEVYDDPSNLFVARFLGVPPINLFNAQVKNGKLYLGEDAIFETDAADGEYILGIRPEGFVIDSYGCMGCELRSVETTGRDVSVIASHPASLQSSFRSIVFADSEQLKGEKDIRFNIKATKSYLFEKGSEDRVVCTLKTIV